MVMLVCKASAKLLQSFCVKPVEHKRLKRKLLQTENGAVCKIKRSKPKNIVEAEQTVHF